jgi:hypothetical protein
VETSQGTRRARTRFRVGSGGAPDGRGRTGKAAPGMARSPGTSTRLASSHGGSLRRDLSVSVIKPALTLASAVAGRVSAL